jgi:hypothetical protein
MTDYDTDVQTAAAALRDLLAETEGKRRNGPASDGRGWFRTDEDRQECYAIADAMLALFLANWDHGVRYNPDKDDVHPCDDPDHAAEWKRDMDWEGPVVRRLTARLAGMPWIALETPA